VPVASKLSQFINKKGVTHQLVHHPRSDHLQHAIELANAVPELSVKAISLVDKRGAIVTVIPFLAELDLELINTTLNRSFQALSDLQADKLFADCEPGMLPPFGMAYGLPVIVDADMLDNDHFFAASGCASTLLKIPGQAFREAMMGAIKARVAKWPRTPAKSLGVGLNSCSGSMSLDSVARKLERLYRLPPMPETAVRIMHLTADPEADVIQLASQIERDPSLSAQVMRYARSALFSYRGELTSVKDAVNIVLGFDRVSQLAMSIAASKAFAISQDGPLGLKKFWKHALYAGVLSQALALLANPDLQLNDKDAYLAGLLHNFGILLIGHLFPPEFKMLNKLRESEPEASMREIEQQVFGIGGAQEFISLGHGSIGGILLKLWGLPASSIKVAAMHQNLRYEGPDEYYVHLIQLVNHYLSQHDIGDEVVEYDPVPVLEKLGIDEQQALELVELTIDQCQSLDAMVGQMVV